MTFLSSQTMRARLAGGIVSPFDPSRVKHGAYELSMGPESFISSATTKVKQTLAAGEQISIPPGQFALLLAEESLQVPAGLLGLISIRAGIKFRGLVNVSGFHVDPGFKGRLKFAVYNAGTKPVIVTRGEPVFMLWFAAFDQEVDDPYHGEYFQQEGLTSQDVMRLQGHVASPASLSLEIADLSSRIAHNKVGLRITQAFVVALLVALIAAAVGLVGTVAANHSHDDQPGGRCK